MRVIINKTLRDNSKKIIKDLCGKGQEIILIKKGTQDEFGEITTESTLSVNGFPIRYAPFNRTTLTRVAWATEIDVLVFISKQVQDDNEVEIRDLKDYGKMKIEDKRYDIKYIEPYTNVKDDFLYYIIGGKKG